MNMDKLPLCFPHLAVRIVELMPNPGSLLRCSASWWSAGRSNGTRARWLLFDHINHSFGRDHHCTHAANECLPYLFAAAVRMHILSKPVWIALLALLPNSIPCTSSKPAANIDDVVACCNSVETISIAFHHRLVTNAAATLCCIVGRGQPDLAVAVLTDTAIIEASQDLAIDIPSSILRLLASPSQILVLADNRVISSKRFFQWCMTRDGLPTLVSVLAGSAGSALIQSNTTGMFASCAPKVVEDAIMRNDADTVQTTMSLASSRGVKLDFARLHQIAKLSGHRECMRVVEALSVKPLPIFQHHRNAEGIDNSSRTAQPASQNSISLRTASTLAAK